MCSTADAEARCLELHDADADALGVVAASADVATTGVNTDHPPNTAWESIPLLLPL